MTLEHDLGVAVASGLPVGVGQRVRCDCCNQRLAPNDDVETYLYQLVDADRVTVAAVRCPDCARDRITTPTLAAREWLVTATLAPDGGIAGPSQLALADVSIRDSSDPDEGSRP